MSIETMRAQVDKVLGEPFGDHDNLLDDTARCLDTLAAAVRKRRGTGDG